MDDDTFGIAAYADDEADPLAEYRRHQVEATRERIWGGPKIQELRATLDPHRSERWSIDMALAWAVFRSLGTLQDAWSEFRRAAGVGLRTRDELELELVYLRAEWPTWEPEMLPDAAWSQFREAIEAGRILSEGIHHPSGEGQEIHRATWADLHTRDDAQLGVIYVDTKGRNTFSHVTVARTSVLQLWPAIGAASAGSQDTDYVDTPLPSPSPSKNAVRAIVRQAINYCKQQGWPKLGAVETDELLSKVFPGMSRDMARSVRRESEFLAEINRNPGQGKKNKQTRSAQIQALCGFLLAAQSHN